MTVRIYLYGLAGIDLNVPIISGINKLYQIKSFLYNLSAFTFLTYILKVVHYKLRLFKQSKKSKSTNIKKPQRLVAVFGRIFIIGKIKDVKEEWIKMLFGMFYIKNYHANYNSYFPLKVKGPFMKKHFF